MYALGSNHPRVNLRTSTEKGNDELADFVSTHQLNRSKVFDLLKMPLTFPSTHFLIALSILSPFSLQTKEKKKKNIITKCTH